MIQIDQEAFKAMFREIIAEEVAKAMQDFRTTQLPPMLNKKDIMKLFGIQVTKASQLLNREDFPVFREAGVLVPTHLLFKWIERNTQWVEENTNYFKKGASA
ncbi:DNA-binding protein [Bacillus sonorensis]|uniref:DNA-binding protein n=1 Tax=Bacillus sonorensis TaxID=119858 RepID=UPI002DBA8734|nr:DNA-binding protein [Bacillus sonorensis]MEC1428822.1 DNA-binding protein [Bacillus sonorensis]